MTKANEYMVAGDHYKRFQYETWDVINDWGLGYFDGNAVKYLSRWRHKNGTEDLRKAAHYIEKLIELEEKRAAAEQITGRSNIKRKRHTTYRTTACVCINT